MMNTVLAQNIRLSKNSFQSPTNSPTVSDINRFATAIKNTPSTHHVDDISALKNAIKIAQPGDTIALKPGNYGTLNVFNKSSITLRGEQPENKPVFKRLNLEGGTNLSLRDIKIDGQNFSSTGLRAKNINGLKILNSEVTRTRDAINIISSQNIELSHNTIKNIRRDGIIAADIIKMTIQQNNISEFHPNYENYQLKNWNGDFLPTKKRRDHADFIQVVNSRGGITINNNTLNATGGAFTQSIFLHNDAHLPGYSKVFYDPVSIIGNRISNGHKHGIHVVGQADVTERSNSLSHIPTKGIAMDKEHAPKITIEKP